MRKITTCGERGVRKRSTGLPCPPAGCAKTHVGASIRERGVYGHPALFFCQGDCIVLVRAWRMLTGSS